jgi:hypothetical protein
MPKVASSQRKFLEVFLEMLEAQEGALDAGDLAEVEKLSALRRKRVDDAAAILPPMVPWQPDVAELASVAHQSLARVQQGTDKCLAVLQQQMAKLTHSQEAVQFYFGQGIVCEQMWVA